MQIWRTVTLPCLLCSHCARTSRRSQTPGEHFIKPQENPLVNPNASEWATTGASFNSIFFLTDFCSIPSIFLWTSVRWNNLHLNSQQAHGESFLLLHLLPSDAKQQISFSNESTYVHAYTQIYTHMHAYSRSDYLVASPIKNYGISFAQYTTHARSEEGKTIWYGHQPIVRKRGIASELLAFENAYFQQR